MPFISFSNASLLSIFVDKLTKISNVVFQKAQLTTNSFMAFMYCQKRTSCTLETLSHCVTTTSRIPASLYSHLWASHMCGLQGKVATSNPSMPTPRHSRIQGSCADIQALGHFAWQVTSLI